MFRAGGRGRPCLAAPAVPIGRCWTQRTGKARARLPIPRGSTSAARNPNTPASRTPKAKGEEEYIVPCSPTLSNAPEPSWRLPAAGIVKQSLEGMRRRGKQFTTLRLSESKDRLRALPSKSKVKPRRGLIQNSQLMDSLRKFDSTVVILKQSDEESVFVSFSRFPPFRRAGRSLGRAEARKHSAVAGRAPRLRPNPRQTYFVILSVSEGSIWGKVTDSSSIFRSPQNDNAVFALNHFLSGTHSSARPGRLRGSRFQREPARAQGQRP